VTTVKELKAYLETLPEDTEVHVACHYSGGYDNGTEWRDMNLDQYSGNVDFNPSGGHNDLYLGEA
jgi:hypothetical protein